MLFAGKLASLVVARIGEVSDDIAHSRGISDWPSYRESVCRLAALEEVLGMIDAVRKQIRDEGSRR